MVISSITNDDEYGMVEAELLADDVVIDVGAHIGTFSLLCHRRGSRAIFAFEPNPETFALLAESMSCLSGVQVDDRAVFRSDLAPGTMALSGMSADNTGTPTLLFAGRPFPHGSPTPQSSAETDVTTVALDVILARFRRVRLLKLDCEGSEFPILLSSRELGRVDEIVGEYHEVSESRMKDVAPAARVANLKSFRVGQLVDRLSQLGFHVEHVPTIGNVGLFRAVRR